MNRLSVLFVLCPFALRAWGQVIYADPLSTSCSTGGPLLGNSVYCCDGLCLDSTHIGSPGKCVAWLDLCGDVDTAPSCAPNQVLSYRNPATVDSGDGCCGACCCECQYVRNNWSWSCCDCPVGYIAVTGGRCGGSPSCVGCGGALQTLTGDEHTGFQCTETPPPPNPCDTAKAVDDTVNNINDWLTKVGTLCPLDNLPAALGTVGQLLYAAAGSSTSNDNGFGLGVTSAFGGLLVAAAVLVGGEVGLTVAAGVAEAYGTVCDALGFIGPVGFAAGVAMDAVTRVECGSNTKRFIPRSSSTTSPTISNNLCSEFLSYFPDYPANTSFAVSLDQECTQLYSDTTYQNITGNLQHLCHEYQNSGNSSLVIAFANLLGAIRNYEPYCGTSTTSVSTSLSSTIIASVSSSTSSVMTSGSASSSARGTSTSSISTSIPGTSHSILPSSSSASGSASSSARGTSTSSISTSIPGTSLSLLSSSSSFGSVSSVTSSSTTSGSGYSSVTGASTSPVILSTSSGTSLRSVPSSAASGTSAPSSHPATSTAFDSTSTCSEKTTGPLLSSASSQTTAASLPSSQSSGTSSTSVYSTSSGSRAAQTTGVGSESTSSSNAESATANITTGSMASSGSQEPSTAAPTVPSKGTQSMGSPTAISGAGTASGESQSGGSTTGAVSSPSSSFTTAGGSPPFSAAAPLRPAANFGMIYHIAVTYMLVRLFFWV